jgi:hypothetical protein
MPSDFRRRRLAQRAFRSIVDNESEASLVPGLDADTIAQLIQAHAESMGYDCEEPQPSRKTMVHIADFGRRLQSAIRRWCEAHEYMLAPGVSADEIYEDESGYAVLQTLNGEGVGIWDGRWDHHFARGKEREAIESLRKELSRALGRFADDTGGGVLNNALNEDAERCSEGDPEAELDEDIEEMDDALERDERELDHGLERDVRALDKPQPRGPRGPRPSGRGRR